MSGRRTRAAKAATELARQAREGVLVPCPPASPLNCAECGHPFARHAVGDDGCLDLDEWGVCPCRAWRPKTAAAAAAARGL